MATRKLIVAASCLAALSAVALLWRFGAPRGAQRDGVATEKAEHGTAAPLASEVAASSQRAVAEPSAPAREALEPAPDSRAGFRRIVRGRVVDSNGEPVVSARVRCVRIVASFPGKGAWGALAALEKSGRTRSPILETDTGASGAFAFFEAPAGLLLIEVEMPGFRVLHSPQLVPNQARDTDVGALALAPGARLAGRVVDERGRPLAHALVSRTTDSDWTRGFFTDYAYLPVARADARGAFDVSSLPEPPWNLRVEHEECIATLLTVDRATTADDALRIELRRGLELGGRVMAAPGIELDALLVHAIVEQEHFERYRIDPATNLTGQCDAEGRFRIARIPPELASEALRLVVGSSQRWSEGLAAPVRARTGELGVRIELAPPMWLEFGARDAATGAALTDFVALREFHVPGRNMPLGGQRVLALPGDAPGRFRVRLPTQLPDDQMQRVHVRPPAHAWYWTPPLATEPGRRVDLGWIDFPAVATQLVSVRDALSGAPVADASVFVADEHALEHRPFALPDYAELEQGGHYTERHSIRTSAADGRVRVALRPGPAWLVVAHRAYRRSEAYDARAAGAQPELVVELHPGATAALRVVARKTSVVGLTVLHTCEHAGIADRMAQHSESALPDALQTNEQGVAIFERLTPGAHHFRVDGHAGAPLVLEVEEDGFREAVLSID